MNDSQLAVIFNILVTLLSVLNFRQTIEYPLYNLRISEAKYLCCVTVD